MTNRILSIAVAVCSLVSIVSADAAERRMLRGHVPAAVARLQPDGNLPGSTNVNLAIGLPLRNQEALTNLLRRIYDPESSDYRRYLTPEQFTLEFGPTERDYQAVIAFAKANGFHVTATHPNRVVLDVEGDVADVEKTFHVTMRMYRHPTEKRMFFAPDTEPSLDLAVPILHISGMDNYALPRPRHRERPLIRTANAIPNAGSGPGGSYRGNDFRAAYVPGTSLTGAGQSVGLLQFDGYYANDIATYIAQAGIQTSVVLTNVPINGGVKTPGSGNAEVAMDIEMAISMAPGLSRVIVYEAPNPSPWVDLLNRMATDNLARQLSCSWGGGPPDATAEQIFQQMAAQGQSFFNASGDSDAFTGSIEFPADSPNITQVGGTTLTTTGPGGSYVSETVWNWGNGVGSSGGISTYYAIPAYQQGISMTANQGSTTMRNMPDVALTADDVYVVYNNGATGIVCGTSCAAPLWAGFMALVNQQTEANGWPPVGFLNPIVYAIGKGASYTGCFHDTTTGDNTWLSSPSKYYAAPGYDLCTGWGTPTGSNLINALAPPPDTLRISPATGFTANGPVGGPFSTTAMTFSLTNAGTGTLTWSLSNDSAWLTVSATNGSLTRGGSVTTVTVSLAAPAASLPAGAYQETVRFSNRTTGATHGRSVSLSIGQSLVQNGGFETGTFAGWTQSGGSSSVQTGAKYAHSGTYGARLKRSSTLGYLSQSLETTIGQTYLVSCWLDSPDGRTPNEFAVAWDGSTLFDQTNIGAIGWTNLQFVVTAGGSSALLQFGFRDDPRYLGLDDISVVPVNLPAISVQPTDQTVTAGGTVTFVSSASGSPPLAYRWQLNSTNIANATNANLTLTGITADQAGTYRVVVTNAYGTATSSNAVLTVIAPVTAAFTASPSNGAAPLAVTFTDTSSGTITNRHWSFGDGVSSNTSGTVVLHTYANAGTYTVGLTVSGPPGAATNTQLDCIVVTNRPPILNVIPSGLSFGSVTIDTTNDLAFTVQNTGGGSLTCNVGGVTAPFSILGGTNCVLTGGGNTNVTVRFVPATAGSHSNNVAFNSNAGSLSRPVTGTATNPPSGMVQFATNVCSVAEYGGAVTVTVVRVGGSFGSVSAAYATSNGTASAGADYTATNGTLTWANADTATKTVVVPILNDAVFESNEVFTVTLSGAASGSPVITVVTIVENAPLISVTPASRDVGAVVVGNTADVTFTVQNIGTGPLAGEASASAPFSVVSGGSYNLTAGQGQVVTVRYAPLAAGSNSNNVTFTGGGGASRPVTGSANYGQVLTPQFTPDGGTYPDELDVTITCGTPGATIRYTTDGRDPTGGDPAIAAGGTLRIAGNTTLKAKAWKVDWADSAVKSGIYAIPEPRVFILSPTNGAVLYTTSVAITARATGSHGLREVRFYKGTNLVGTTNLASGPVSWSNTFVWAGAPVGTNSLSAQVSDVAGNTATSAVVVFRIIPRATGPRLFVQLPAGEVQCWFVNPDGTVQSVSSVFEGATAAQIRGAGDIDRDGVSDLVWQAPAGSATCWFMNADGTPKSAADIYTGATSWQIRGAGDIDKNGIADLVWQAANGQATCWFMKSNGAMRTWTYIYKGTTAWQIRGAGDIDKNGIADLVWQAANGQATCWFMKSNGTMRTWAYINRDTTAWQIRGAGDIDGDGIAEVFWQAPTGEARCWFVNTNGTCRTWVDLNTTPTSWQVRAVGK